MTDRIVAAGQGDALAGRVGEKVVKARIVNIVTTKKCFQMGEARISCRGMDETVGLKPNNHESDCGFFSKCSDLLVKAV